MHLFRHRIVRLSKILLALTFLNAIQLSNAQDYDWASDFSVGSSIIDISAQDQHGMVQTFDGLVGEKGLLFMLSRSFDW